MSQEVSDSIVTAADPSNKNFETKSIGKVVEHTFRNCCEAGAASVDACLVFTSGMKTLKRLSTT